MIFEIIAAIVFIAFVVLQFVWLGKKKLLGLLLPLICLAASLFAIFFSNIFSSAVDLIQNGDSYSVVIEQNGAESQHIFKDEGSAKTFVSSLDDSCKILSETKTVTDNPYAIFGKLLLASNIPTLALLTIYFDRRIRVLFAK